MSSLFTAQQRTHLEMECTFMLRLIWLSIHHRTVLFLKGNSMQILQEVIDGAESEREFGVYTLVPLVLHFSVLNSQQVLSVFTFSLSP